MAMTGTGRKVLTVVGAFLFTVCLLNECSWQVAATTDPKDVTALQTLYNFWLGQSGNNLPKNWVGTDPCGSTWAGVTCDGSFTHVTNLSMINYNLAGGIPSAIGDLSSLEYLDLSFNPQLGGPIPEQLGKLKSLSHLALMDCGLTGSIPSSLGNLVNIEFLALNQNNLRGQIPAEIGYLGNMTWFDISENHLVSPIPFSDANPVGLDNLTSCKHVHFYNNSLSGSLPVEFFKLPNLLHLLVSFNNFNGSFDGSTLQYAKSLQILSLDHNLLVGPLPPELNNVTTLQKLNLNGNSFTGSLPDLSKLTGLQLLDVGYNSFDRQPIPPWTYSLQVASTIAMPSCDLTGPLNSSIFNLPGVMSIDLSNNALNGTVAFSSPSSTLQEINLQYNNLTDLTGGSAIQGPQFSSGSLRLFGNPLCSPKYFGGSGFCLQPPDGNAPFQWQAPNNPFCTLSCSGGQTLNPNLCTCAIPLVCHMQLTEPSFRSVNSTMVTSLSKEVANDFKGLSVISDDKQVYIGALRFTDRGRMLFNLSFFPVSGDFLNGTEINVIIAALSANSFPLTEGPYIMRNFSLPPAASSSSKSKTSIGLIVGIVLAVVVVAVIIALIALYAIRQKKRADKAEVSRPFASWGTISKDGGEAPELKGARWFSLAELRKATNNFSEDNEIGAGGYGTVYKALLPNGKLAAVKRADQSSLQGAGEFKNEIELLSRVHHKNLVGLIGFCYENGEQMLVYEYIEYGTLREHLLGHYGKPLSWDTRVAIALGSAKGLTYLHELANPPIIHRDIKSANLMLSESMTAKVADFGLSRLAPEGADQDIVSTQVKGTLGYLDPEYYMTNQLSEKSDVYSFGVVLLEMLSARPPIERGRYIVREVRTALDKGGLKALEPLLDPLLGDFPTKQLEDFLDLALQCVEEVAAGRPTMNEVVKKLEVIAGHSQPNSGVHITIEPQKEDSLYEKDYLEGIDDRSFQYSGASFTSQLPVEPK